MAVSAIDQLIRMVSLSKNRQLSQFSVMYDIENFFQHHQDLVIENWHFYNGLHKLFFKKYQGENIADFAARVEDATIENHIKHIVDLMVAHLYGDGRTVQRYVKRMKEGSKEAEVDEELLKKIWLKSRRNPARMIELCHDYAIELSVKKTEGLEIEDVRSYQKDGVKLERSAPEEAFFSESKEDATRGKDYKIRVVDKSKGVVIQEEKGMDTKKYVIKGKRR